MSDWQNLYNFLVNSGMLLLFPTGILILGLLMRVKPFLAIKSGILMMVSFVGIKMLVCFVCDAMKPVIAYFETINGKYQAIDVGWQAFALSSFVLPFGLLCVVAGFLMNLFLIKKHIVRTLNTDIWDYCHILFCGAIAWVLFHSFLFSVCVCLFIAFLTLKCADKAAGAWQDHTESPGTTGSVIYHLTTIYPVYWLCDKFIDIIPGVKNVNVSLDALVLKLRPWSDSVIIGTIIGGGLGLWARLPLVEIIQLAFVLALFLVLSGRITALFMEGLSPISSAAKKWAISYLGKESSYLLGMDFSLGQGDITAINASILMIPLALILALALPGINFFPTSLIPNLIVYTCVGSMACRGNLFRVMIGSVVMIVFMLYAQTWLMPLTTSLLRAVGIDLALQATGGSAPNIFALIIALVGKLMGKW